MEVVGPGEAPPPVEGSAVTIGAYDGVHLGHRALLHELRRRAKEAGLRSVVVTFDRHPALVVRPESAPKLLTDLDQKIELLGACGIERALVVPFDARRAEEPAEDFVAEVLVEGLRARLVVVGEDFHFGHGRKGDVGLLTEEGRRRGFAVEGVSLSSQGGEAVSSTRIRRLLDLGEVEAAATLLGRDHEVRGPVVRGDGRGGAELAMPTANVAVPAEIALPGDGVYAGWCSDAAGVRHPAAVSVGTRPTYYGGQPGPRLLEAHLLDFSGDLYGVAVAVTFHRRLRAQRRFTSSEELAAQMVADAEEARRAVDP